MDMQDLRERLASISADCAAEQARLARMIERGETVDGEWYARLEAIECMTLAAEGIVMAMQESDTFELGGEDAYK